jgi:hypothetical protein
MMIETFDMPHTRAQQPEQIQEHWSSEAARKRWTEAIRGVRRRWREIEWRSVAEGLRACALLEVPDADLPGFSEMLASAGLDLTPVQRVAQSTTYVNRLVEARPGQAGIFFCLVSRTEHAAEFIPLWKSYSHAGIGRLLGYPSCCVEFFARVWSQYSDTTWPAARNTPGHIRDASGLRCEVRGPWQTNMLLRWLSVRAVPHFPCSFSCEATVKFANTLAAICPDERGSACEEMLRWPVEWSAQDGCVEIRAPEVTISTITDVTKERYTVQRLEPSDNRC